MDISLRPAKRIVREFQRYEDVDFPARPPALPRPRRGLWAPPGPEAIEAPETLVVGLGRRLRSDKEAAGPRARFGAGAVEALQRRYGISTHFDVKLRSYLATCKSSLDRTGQAGVQTASLLQPLADFDSDVGAALYRTMQQRKLERASVLLAFSDPRLPFGQLRMRTTFDGENPLVRSAMTALNAGNRVTCLHIGCGAASAGEGLLAAEVGALPRVLGNAATAIELWLSEADLGLVMRFVNRPEVYEMPPGWPYSSGLRGATEARQRQTQLQDGAVTRRLPQIRAEVAANDEAVDSSEAPGQGQGGGKGKGKGNGTGAEAQEGALRMEGLAATAAEEVADAPSLEEEQGGAPAGSSNATKETMPGTEASLSLAETRKVEEVPEPVSVESEVAEPTAPAEAALASYNLGSLIGPSEGDSFALFDLNRDDPTSPRSVNLSPLSGQGAVAMVEERPPNCTSLCLGKRRFRSFSSLKEDFVQMVVTHRPGMHLRFEDDEDAVKTLISFHPDSDRLLEDLVAIKVDCSPIDDNISCFWVIKFDGYEEDVSLKACLDGLQQWLSLQPPHNLAGYISAGQRLGLGRWTRGLRETTFERASMAERMGRKDANR